jgi:hypothetical protein
MTVTASWDHLVMAIPFTAYPIRQVPPEPAEARWTVPIHRSGAWPGWRWLDRVLDLNWVGDFGFIPLLLLPLAFPSIVLRWTAYRLRGRTDWDVLVYDESWSGEYRPSHAVLVENWGNRAEAAARAEAVSAHLTKLDALPEQGE